MGRYSPDAVRLHYIRMAAAVFYMHELGLAHQDISFENMMLRVNNVLKWINPSLSTI